MHERLRQARIEAGYRSASAAARALRMKVPTYTHHENGTHAFTPEHAMIYGRRFGCDPMWLLYGDNQPRPSTGRDIIPLQPSIRNDQYEAVQQLEVAAVPVIGEIAAGRWIDAEGPATRTPLSLVPSAPNENVEDQVAFQVQTACMDRKGFLVGDYVICAPYQARRGSKLRSGDIVVVERSRGDLIERTIRQIEIHDDRVELWPRSSDPRLHTPIVLEGDGTTRIAYLVLGKFAPVSHEI